MEKKIIKITYHQFPKQKDALVIWKYKIEYYSDGSSMFIGLWF